MAAFVEYHTIICLDTSVFLEDTLVISSSIMGEFCFDLTVSIASENVHSGYSGILPEIYFIAMTLLGKICDH